MIGRFDPFAELARLQNEMSWVKRATRQDRQDRRALQFQPAVDIFESNDAIVVEADLPGVKAEDIHISGDSDEAKSTEERVSAKLTRQAC